MFSREKLSCKFYAFSAFQFVLNSLTLNWKNYLWVFNILLSIDKFLPDAKIFQQIEGINLSFVIELNIIELLN